jgi:hypothetical protein
MSLVVRLRRPPGVMVRISTKKEIKEKLALIVTDGGSQAQVNAHNSLLKPSIANLQCWILFSVFVILSALFYGTVF